MSNRNRSEGWIYAKRSGHSNEELVKERLLADSDFRDNFLSQIGLSNKIVKSVSIGGLNETDVDSVLNNGKTKSKTDMYVSFEDGDHVNVSIKKSLGGQVYLITDSHFIEGFEKQFNLIIPENIKRAIRLFWGSANDTLDIVNMYGTNKVYEIRKHRVVANTLALYDRSLYDGLLMWVKDNICNIAKFCFSTGLAKQKEDWADIVWYINELGDEDFNCAYRISILSDKLQSVASQNTKYGTRGNGTTIQLPFGFVQWHSPRKTIPGCIQFHHNYYLIKDLVK